MITTINANEEGPIMDYSTLLDEALIRLRRELRSDLHIISEIDWDKESAEKIKESAEKIKESAEKIKDSAEKIKDSVSIED